MTSKYKNDHIKNTKGIGIFIIFCAIIGILAQIYNGILFIKTNHPIWFYTLVSLSIITLTIGAYLEIKESQNAPETGIKKNFLLENETFKESRYDNQIKFIEDVECMTRRSILSKEESASFYAAKNAIKDYDGFHLHAQVSMGEIIKCYDPDRWKSDNAFRSINSKRVDMLICNNWGTPVLAIEYQGGGHNVGENSEKRNIVKHLALKKAGISLLETYPEDTIEKIENMIKVRLMIAATE